MKCPSELNDMVHLAGFDASGGLVHQQYLERQKYWEGAHPVIDDHEFRSNRLIVRLTCTLYNESGQVDEICEDRYDADGRRIGW